MKGWNYHATTELLELYSVEIVYKHQGEETRIVRGKHQFELYPKGLWNSIPDFEFKLLKTVCNRNIGLGEWIGKGIFQGERCGHNKVVEPKKIEYEGVEVGMTVSVDPALVLAVAILPAALLADYAFLYGYALYHNSTTMYIDVEGSWGTQWYNFYQLGAYGEEGVFSGNFNSNSGTFYPVCIAGVSDLETISAMNPHSGVWNPMPSPCDDK